MYAQVCGMIPHRPLLPQRMLDEVRERYHGTVGKFDRLVEVVVRKEAGQIPERRNECTFQNDRLVVVGELVEKGVAVDNEIHQYDQQEQLLRRVTEQERFFTERLVRHSGGRRLDLAHGS